MAGKSLRDRAIERIHRRRDFDPPPGPEYEAEIALEIETIRSEAAGKKSAKNKDEKKMKDAKSTPDKETKKSKAKKSANEADKPEVKPKEIAPVKENAAIEIEEASPGKEQKKVLEEPKPEKRGPGQPKKYDETVGISFRLPKDTVELMKDLAVLGGCTRTDIVIDLIADAAEARKDKLLALRALRS